MARKKKVVAGVFGDSTYYFNDKGEIVDDSGQPAPPVFAKAIAASGLNTPTPEPAKPARQRKAKQPPQASLPSPPPVADVQPPIPEAPKQGLGSLNEKVAKREGFFGSALKSAAESEYDQKDASSNKKALGRIADRLIARPARGIGRVAKDATSALMATDYVGLGALSPAAFELYGKARGKQDKSIRSASNPISSGISAAAKGTISGASSSSNSLDVLKEILTGINNMSESVNNLSENIKTVSSTLDRQNTDAIDSRREIKQQNEQIIRLLEIMANVKPGGSSGSAGVPGVSEKPSVFSSITDALLGALPFAGAFGSGGGGTSPAGAPTGNGKGFLSKSGRVLGSAVRTLGTPLTMLAEGYESYNQYNEANDKLQKGEISENDANVLKTKAVTGGVGGIGGALAGASTGAMAGAALGSVVPVIGTAIGGTVGGLAGGLLGAWGGRAVGEAAPGVLGVETDAERKKSKEALEKKMNEPQDNFSIGAFNWFGKKTNEVANAVDFNRGTSGTLNAQNIEERVNEIMKEKSVGYNEASKLARAEVEGKDPSAFMMATNKISSNRESSLKSYERDKDYSSAIETPVYDALGNYMGADVKTEYEKAGKSIEEKSKEGIVSNKVDPIFGTEFLGALLSKKGLDTGSFMGTVRNEKTFTSPDGKEEKSFNMGDILGTRKSGGLFGSDEYEVHYGNDKLNVSKLQYMNMQEDIANGEPERAIALFNKLNEKNKQDIAKSLEPSNTSTTFNSAARFNAGSAQLAAQSAGGAPTVINNNTVNNNTSGGKGASPSRASGTPSTSPVQSHLDMILYGTTYGGGII